MAPLVKALARTRQREKKQKSALSQWAGVICLAVVLGLFYYLGRQMGMANMLNTLMHTAHDLLLNTVFYLMGICVLTGAIGRLFVEFGVVRLLERILRPLMRPLFNLPGVASLGAVMTFLRDTPTTPPSSPWLPTSGSAHTSRSSNTSRSPTSVQPLAWASS